MPKHSNVADGTAIARPAPPKRRPLAQQKPVAVEATVSNVSPVAGPMRLLDRKQLLEKVPMSFQKVWQLMRIGEFPAAREIGTKAVWLESEVDAWVLELPKRTYKAPDKKEAA